MNAWYFVIAPIVILLILLIIALLLPKIGNRHQPNQNLDKLYALCQEVLGSNYQITQSEKYLTLIKNNQKIALITLDHKLDTHTRTLGNSLIMNFKQLPNKQVLEQAFLKEKIIQYN